VRVLGRRVGSNVRALAPLGPGADPARIRLGFEGARNLRVDAQGDLLAETTGGAVRWQKPVVYQETDGVRKTIEGRYLLRRGHQVSFEVAAYDRAKPLVIDPTLDYSTYLGGNGDDYGDDIAIDGGGSAYVVGETTSTNFPIMGAYQAANGGNSDTFVTKLNATGSAIIYSTYIGGSGNEGRGGIAVDTAGDVYVVGETRSTNFPTTPGAYQTVNRSSQNNAFVTKLNPFGNALIYSTYLGGNGFDSANAVAIDSGGNAYVAGQTAGFSNFPVLNAYQSSPTSYYMAFVTKLNADGTSLLYSTVLGGNNYTYGAQSIAADNAGNVYVTGPTAATDFPVVGQIHPKRFT
jgi:hypothetical protein